MKSPKAQSSLTHLPIIGRGKFAPRESEVKTQRTPVLGGLPGSPVQLGLKNGTAGM
jgi:hypothetical protein